MSVLRRLDARDRRALVVGLVLLGPGLVWLVGVRPYRTAVASLEERVHAERDLLEREVALLGSAEEITRAARKARHRGEAIETRLVVAPNPTLAETELINEIEVIGVESRVFLQGIRSISVPVDVEAAGALLPMRLAVEGESDLEGVLTFLERLEGHRWLIRVAGITLTPRTDDEGDEEGSGGDRPVGVLEFGIVVEAFTRPPEASSRLEGEEGR